MDNLNTWWSHDSVSASIADDTTYIAFQNGEAVGTLTVGQFEGEPVIWKIYVVPKAHGCGIGTELMNTALTAIGPAHDVRIEFVKGNSTAQAFYERRGFKFDFEEGMAEGSLQSGFVDPPAQLFQYLKLCPVERSSTGTGRNII